MSKVTSKYQLTLPRKIARAHKIAPGTELSFVSSGESLRVVIHHDSPLEPETETDRTALAGFDAATLRQAERNSSLCRILTSATTGLGWSREDLYARRIARGECE
jgi:bifunctional DNA-binding transcriptional regulator/antitoxin component of YhaV-PrlF toxin-antitoxin module